MSDLTLTQRVVHAIAAAIKAARANDRRLADAGECPTCGRDKRGTERVLLRCTGCYAATESEDLTRLRCRCGTEDPRPPLEALTVVRANSELSLEDG